jgi:hypothetical protein
MSPVRYTGKKSPGCHERAGPVCSRVTQPNQRGEHRLRERIIAHG